VIGLLLAFSALAVVVDPARAPLVLIVLLATTLFPWRSAWKSARGTALRPALVWAALAIALAALAQAVAWTEPVAGGRPVTGRLTYLAVLATLAALISVLNARSPGGNVWAMLMVLLIVVFLVPWLEDQTRLRRAVGLAPVHLDAPWTIFYVLLVVVGVTNYLPTRFGFAAVALSVVFILEYLALTRQDWPPVRRSSLWSWVAWALATSVWIARYCATGAQEARGNGERIWFWFRDYWGVVWALRALERFNRSAELNQWPVRLWWFGLVSVDSAKPDEPLQFPVAAEAAFRGLIRRFAEPWRLDQAGQPPCEPSARGPADRDQAQSSSGSAGRKTRE
jgi:hypothetical protein